MTSSTTSLESPFDPIVAPDKPTRGYGQLESDYVRPFAYFQHSNNPAHRTTMLKAVQPIMDMAAQKYGSGNVGPLLKSRAKQLTLAALRSYDPARGPLKPHLMSQLQGLRRVNARQQQMLSVPEQVALDQQHLVQMEKELEDQLNRFPSAAELADATGMSVKRIKYVRQYAPGFAEGQLQAMNQDEEGGGFEPAVVGQDTVLRRAEFIHADASPVDQVILERLLGLHGAQKMSVSALARHLNLSPGAVSQRADRLQQQIDELSGFGIF